MATKTIGQLTQATTINNGDEFAIEQSGVTKRVAASVVRGDIVNANIKSDAAIAYSKLAPLNSAQILVGNGSNVATAVNVTGDVTISNAGVTAIAAGAVVTADLADSAVTTAKVNDAAITPAKLSQPYTLDTAKASTSGTSIDFTGIPSWAKRITVMFDKVSANGSSFFLVQLGDAGGFETSGYESFLTAAATTLGTDNTTAGFRAGGGLAARSYRGIIQICLLSGNTWVASGTLNDWNSNNAFVSGSKALSDTLTQVRFTTVNGTDTFDAGTINVSYEG